MWLLEKPKAAVSEHRFEVNVLRDLKHSSGVHDSIFMQTFH